MRYRPLAAVAGLAGLAVLACAGRLAAQTSADSTLAQLNTVIATYEPARAIKWIRASDPYQLDGFYDKGLKWASRFEIHINVTHQSTIWIRVYPLYDFHHINVNRVNNPNGLMQQMLRMSFHNFFFWGLNDSGEAFAGYQFTLESGFPDAAVREVIKSIPLIDDSVGDLTPFILP